MEENRDFLTSQIITYLGNKRSLINEIEKSVIDIKQKLNKEKCVCADLFAGSGIVSRMLKKHSNRLIVNDLESYSYLINSCYLSNMSIFNEKLYTEIYNEIQSKFETLKVEGIVSENYAPKDDNEIKYGERVFYTHENAVRIDTYRKLINDYTDSYSEKYFLAPLITEASVHTNTSGVFKGFYKDKNTGIGCFGGTGKNALNRIFGKIELLKPVFSNFETELILYQEDISSLVEKLKQIDITYLDPPYNQHPYGSNYFMLNLIIKNKIEAPMSKVSGIVNDWNRSIFNKPHIALKGMEHIISSLDSKFIIISYNSEGFITLEEMTSMLEKYGKLKIEEIKYNTFRGSRNLRERNIHVNEYLFILEKK